ncbi:MAG: hypothetical protein ACI4WX_05895 [Aristaeellaceae bacterium]
MEEKRMEKDLNQMALSNEEIEAVNGGMSGLEAIETLDIPKLFEQPIQAADEARAVLAESYKEFLEEIRKYGWPVKQ